MKTHVTFKNILCSCLLLISITAYVIDNSEIWIDYSNNTQLTLAADGSFRFANAAAVTQGSYTMQNNVLMMQGVVGNHYQYQVLSYSSEQMVLSDQNGVAYTYVSSQKHNSTNNNSQLNTKLPWNNPQYNNILSQSGSYQWRERENWVYVEFLQFLIGHPISQTEVAAIRQDFIKQFNQRPEAFINEARDIEATMAQVYSLNNMQQVAMVREEMSTTFNNMVKQQPQMNNYAFVQTLNKYVRILSIDTNSNLSLSNQDVAGYINYLQFQAMLMGQNYQLTEQDRQAMQFWLVNEFNNLGTEQKQTMAFAGFIWNNLAIQWSNMNAYQQQQYLNQVQSQMNIQNVAVNPQTTNNFWNNANQYDYTSSYTTDFNAQAYVNYAESVRKADNQMFTAMQNSLTESHVTMMNIINVDSDYEYVVDYGDDYGY